MRSSASPTPRAMLLDLPAELILDIHLLALNPHFALVAPRIHHILNSPPSTYAARYLMSLYSYYGPNDLLVRCLRHPICNVEVAQEIKRVWETETGNRGMSAMVPNSIHSLATEEHAEANNTCQSSEVSNNLQPLTCAELPRRLFRTGISLSEPVHPVLRYLYTCYTPSANSHKGYPLCRAVLTANYPLIAFLLSHGADPLTKNCLAVEIAISKRDLKAVVMLVNHIEQMYGSNQPEHRHGAKSMGANRCQAKRPRLVNRTQIPPRLVEMAMRKGADEIVQYFVHEKGAMPGLRSIMELGISA